MLSVEFQGGLTDAAVLDISALLMTSAVTFASVTLHSSVLRGGSWETEGAGWRMAPMPTHRDTHRLQTRPTPAPWEYGNRRCLNSGNEFEKVLHKSGIICMLTLDHRWPYKRFQGQAGKIRAPAFTQVAFLGITLCYKRKRQFLANTVNDFQHIRLL